MPLQVHTQVTIICRENVEDEKESHAFRRIRFNSNRYFFRVMIQSIEGFFILQSTVPISYWEGRSDIDLVTSNNLSCPTNSSVLRVSTDERLFIKKTKHST